MGAEYLEGGAGYASGDISLKKEPLGGSCGDRATSTMSVRQSALAVGVLVGRILPWWIGERATSWQCIHISDGKVVQKKPWLSQGLEMSATRLWSLLSILIKCTLNGGAATQRGADCRY